MVRTPPRVYRPEAQQEQKVNVQGIDQWPLRDVAGRNPTAVSPGPTRGAGSAVSERLP